MDEATRAAWAEAWGTWVAGGFTLLALIWAMFHEGIYSWIKRPQLSLSIELSPPDCMKLAFGRTVIVRTQQGAQSVQVPEPFPVYYLRLRVQNAGKRTTDTVQVRLKRVEQLTKRGEYAAVPALDNLNLTWARQENGKNLVFLPTLQRGAYEHCNLAHIFRPSDRQKSDGAFLFEQKTWFDVCADQTILSIDIADKPFHLPHLLPPGSYRLQLIASSADTGPIAETFELELSGHWYDEEDRMFGEGVKIRCMGRENPKTTRQRHHRG